MMVLAPVNYTKEPEDEDLPQAMVKIISPEGGESENGIYRFKTGTEVRLGR